MINPTMACQLVGWPNFPYNRRDQGTSAKINSMPLSHKASAASLAAVSAIAIIATTASAPAQAAGHVYMSKVQYDSPGSDTGSNSSLNAEWVRITNSTGSQKTLTGWTLRDTSSHGYTFPTTTLKAGGSLRVHTGKGTNTATDKYQQRAWYVWNNTGDTATLKTKAGTVIDTCKWGNGSGTTSC